MRNKKELRGNPSSRSLVRAHSSSASYFCKEVFQPPSATSHPQRALHSEGEEGPSNPSCCAAICAVSGISRCARNDMTVGARGPRRDQSLPHPTQSAVSNGIWPIAVPVINSGALWRLHSGLQSTITLRPERHRTLFWL